MVIIAKFSSVCPCCNRSIAIGSKVEWSKGSKARHVGCGSVSPGPGAVRAVTRGYSRGYSRGAGSAANVPGYSSYCTGRSDCGCYDCE